MLNTFLVTKDLICYLSFCLSNNPTNCVWLNLFSEQAECLLLAISLPLLLSFPFILRHFDVLGELFVAQVVLLLGCSDAFGEA